MAAGASFSGGGFVAPGGMHTTASVLLLSLLPMYTFIMATYNGSLLALLIVTLAMVVIGIVPHTRRLIVFG